MTCSCGICLCTACKQFRKPAHPIDVQRLQALSLLPEAHSLRWLFTTTLQNVVFQKIHATEGRWSALQGKESEGVTHKHVLARPKLIARQNSTFVG